MVLHSQVTIASLPQSCQEIAVRRSGSCIPRHAWSVPTQSPPLSACRSHWNCGCPWEYSSATREYPAQRGHQQRWLVMLNRCYNIPCRCLWKPSIGFWVHRSGPALTYLKIFCEGEPLIQVQTQFSNWHAPAYSRTEQTRVRIFCVESLSPAEAQQSSPLVLRSPSLKSTLQVVTWFVPFHFARSGVLRLPVATMCCVGLALSCCISARNGQVPQPPTDYYWDPPIRTFWWYDPEGLVLYSCDQCPFWMLLWDFKKWHPLRKFVECNTPPGKGLA